MRTVLPIQMLPRETRGERHKKKKKLNKKKTNEIDFWPLESDGICLV